MLSDKISNVTCYSCLDGRHRCKTPGCVCNICRKDMLEFNAHRRRKLAAIKRREKARKRAIYMAENNLDYPSRELSLAEIVEREKNRYARSTGVINGRDHRPIPKPMKDAIIKCSLLYGMSTRTIAERSGISRYQIMKLLRKEFNGQSVPGHEKRQAVQTQL